MNRRKVAAVAVIPALALVLAACSSTSDTAEPAATPSATATPDPTMTEEPAPIGGDPATWSPVVVTPDDDGAAFDAEVGQTMLFEGFDADGVMPFLVSDNEMVVEVSQGGVMGGVTQTPGAQAIGPGLATVSVWSGDPAVENAIPLASVSVTVAVPGGGELIVGDNPATWSPVLLTPDENNLTVNVVPGQAIVFDRFPMGPDTVINVMSDNPDVVLPTQGEVTDTMTTNPGALAISPGTAQLVVWDGFPADGAAEPIAQYTVKVSMDASASMAPQMLGSE
jgi:hypothetical protein